jgi:hypothetical protein
MVFMKSLDLPRTLIALTTTEIFLGFVDFALFVEQSASLG